MGQPPGFEPCLAAPLLEDSAMTFGTTRTRRLSALPSWMPALLIPLLLAAGSRQALAHYYPCDELVRSQPTGARRLYPVSGATFPRGDCQDRLRENSLRFLLVDSRDDQAIWSIDAPARPGWGAQANLHDSGWLVLTHAGPWVVGIEPRKGAVAFQIDLKAHLPEDVFATTGYPEDRGVQGELRRSFAEVGDRLYFVIRTDRGRFIPIDLLAGRLVELPSPELATALLDAERRWISEVLSGALTRLQGITERAARDAAEVEVRQAMDVAVVHGQVDIVPDLLALETYGSFDSSSNSHCASRDGIDLDGSSTNSMRLSAQWALRRLGARPRGPSPVALNRAGPEEYGIRDPLLSVQDRQPQLVRKGMPVSEVLRLVGTPDSASRCQKGVGTGVDCPRIGRHFPYWDYFIDDPKPWTLRIWWAADGTIAGTERRSPRWVTHGRQWLTHCDP